MIEEATFNADTVRWLMAAPDMPRFSSIVSLYARAGVAEITPCGGCGRKSKRGEISAQQMDSLFDDPRFAADLPALKQFLQVRRLRVTRRGLPAVL